MTCLCFHMDQNVVRWGKKKQQIRTRSRGEQERLLRTVIQDSQYLGARSWLGIVDTNTYNPGIQRNLQSQGDSSSSDFNANPSAISREKCFRKTEQRPSAGGRSGQGLDGWDAFNPGVLPPAEGLWGWPQRPFLWQFIVVYQCGRPGFDRWTVVI